MSEPAVTMERYQVERLSKMLDLMAGWLDFGAAAYNDPWVNAAGAVARIAADEVRVALGGESELDGEVRA